MYTYSWSTLFYNRNQHNIISKYTPIKINSENVNSKDSIDTISEPNPTKIKVKNEKCDQKSYWLWELETKQRKLETKFIDMFMLRGNK